MKTYKTILIAILVAVSGLSISPAYADHGYYGGHGYYYGGHGYYWSGGCWGCGAWILGAAIATDIAITQAQQPVYVAPPPVYMQPVPQPVYVQAPPAYAPVQPQVQAWYFCKSANGYYPYVTICPEGWQPVPAQPPQIAPH